MANDPAEEGLYELAPEELPPPSPGPSDSIASPAASPPVLGYRAPAPSAGPGQFDPEPIKNLYLPLWLLGGGILVEVGATFFFQHNARTALISVGVNLLLGTALMLGGLLLAARWRGIDLGSFGAAVLKLAALSVAPAAAMTLLSPFFHVIPLLGGLLAWVGAFILYFALLGLLFDLDESDTWYCIAVIFLVRLAFYFLLLGAAVWWAL
jgi:hypothetical protein